MRGDITVIYSEIYAHCSNTNFVDVSIFTTVFTDGCIVGRTQSNNMERKKLQCQKQYKTYLV
jgi:hypothetical protein